MTEILSGVKAKTTPNGLDYAEGELGEAMNQKSLIGDIVSHWKTHGENRPTLCFATNIAHSKAILEDFAAAGVPAAHLDAYTPDLERKRLIAGFREGSVKLLTSVNVLGIGFDVPDAACLILARPTLSEALHMQQMGRGIRTAPGKKDCIVLDHASNTLKHGLPIHFEVPDLDDGTKPERGERKRKERLAFVACSECGAVMEPDEWTCPNCGIDRPRRANAVATVDGQLVEFGTGKGGDDHRVDKRGWHLAMLWWTRQRGKADGAAYYLFLDKFKEKPVWGWRDLTPVEPTPEQARWIRGQQQRRKIAWRKAQGGIAW